MAWPWSLPRITTRPSLIEPVKEDAPPEEPKAAEKPKRKSKADESVQLGMFG